MAMELDEHHSLLKSGNHINQLTRKGLVCGMVSFFPSRDAKPDEFRVRYNVMSNNKHHP